MAKPITERILSLKEKQEQLTARLNNLQTKVRQEDRKRDTRRKIVVGGAVLLAMGKDPDLAARVADILARTVGRPIDRAVIADLIKVVASDSAA